MMTRSVLRELAEEAIDSALVYVSGDVYIGGRFYRTVADLVDEYEALGGVVWKLLTGAGLLGAELVERADLTGEELELLRSLLRVRQEQEQGQQ